MTVPGTDQIATASTTYERAYAILEAKYGSAGAWATWAGSAVETALTNMTNEDANFGVDELVTSVIATLDAFPAFSAPSIASYVAPTKPVWEAASAKPTLEAVPAYVAPVLGNLSAIPNVSNIVLPDTPSATVAFTKSTFTSSLHSFLTDFVEEAMGAGSTGLGDAEDALFARAVARENAARTQAYNEITATLSSNGFPSPTGALVSAQAMANNESALRLSDINAQIMAESARLSNSYGQALLQASMQLDTILVGIWNSSEERAFNKAREDVIQAVNVFTAAVGAAVSQGELDVSRVQAVTAANEGVVKVYMAQIDSQIEPMKAVIGLNTALVQQYGVEVGAVSDLNKAASDVYAAEISGEQAKVNASVAEAEALSKVYQVGSNVALAKADVTSKYVLSQVDAAVRQYAAKLGAYQASAQIAGQMVASALNGVNVSSSFTWGGSSSSSESTSNNTNINIDQ